MSRALAFCKEARSADAPRKMAEEDLAALFDLGQGQWLVGLRATELVRAEWAFGAEHPEVVAGLNDLAALCRAHGRDRLAELLYRQALAVSEKALGPAHPDLAASRNNLAILYANYGERDKAPPLYMRTLTIWEKTFGPKHSQVAAIITNLAALYPARGEYAEAEELEARTKATGDR